jgi:hypothetical protein
MVNQWEAWAKRTGAIPWIWQPQYGEKPTATESVLKGAKKGKKAKSEEKSN